MARASIEKHNGEPTLMIDGVPYPPMAITICRYDEGYLKRLGEAGFRLFYVQARTRWLSPEGVDENGEIIADGFTQARERIETLIKVIPDAYVIIRLNCNPPMDWLESHTDELRTYNDGSYIRPYDGVYPRNKYEAAQSTASELWKRDASVAILDFCEELEKYPCFARVIGIFLVGGMGYKTEWIFPGMLHSDGRYGDCSKPFKKAYGNWLKNKYGTEAALQKAWRRDDATFDDPIIPSAVDRDVIGKANKKISSNISSYLTVPQENAKGESHCGVFLNMDTHIHTADFYDAYHDITADLILHFARVLKKKYPAWLFGTFYGNLASMSFYDSSTVTGIFKLLDSGVIDFLSGPDIYRDREPGKCLVQREMQDTFRLRNLLYVRENDVRTHLTMPYFQRERMGVSDVEDSITVLKRDFAHTICDDVYAWWFDMRGHFTDIRNEKVDDEVFWYDDPDILKLFKRQQEIAKEAYDTDRTKKNEIAVIADNDSFHCVSNHLSSMTMDTWRISDLHQIGAPVDWYFHDDMSKPNMPDYKLYIMANQYDLNDEQRAQIFAKARKNHAMVLWLYAPGFIDRENNVRMSIENIEKTVGMKVGYINYAQSPFFRIEDKAHSVLRFADKYRRYGYIEQAIRDNLTGALSFTETPYVNPCFYIDDDNVQVLGRYTGNKLVSFAMREMDGFTSVYCCTPTLNKELLASLAEYAGCHLYTDTRDILYANEHYVAIHATYSGMHHIDFKKVCTPVEVYEQKAYGELVSSIDVEMHFGETKMWKIR